MKLSMPLDKATALAFYGSAGLFALVMVIILGFVVTQTEVSDFLRFLVSSNNGARPEALLLYATLYIPCLVASLVLGWLYGSDALKTKRAKAIAALGGAILTAAILLGLDIRFGVFAAVGTVYATAFLLRA